MKELIVHRECKEGSDIKQGKERRGSLVLLGALSSLFDTPDREAPSVSAELNLLMRGNELKTPWRFSGPSAPCLTAWAGRHRVSQELNTLKQGQERRKSLVVFGAHSPLLDTLDRELRVSAELNLLMALLSRWGPSGDTPGNGHSACRESVVQGGSSTGESHALAQQLSAASRPPWQPRLGHWALPSAHQCVPGEAFPDAFRMGQLNCTHGSRSKRERVPIRSLEVLLCQRVRVTWGRETRERDLFLLSDVLIIAKPKRGGAPRPKLVLALDQLQVLCGSTGAAGDGAQEEEGKNSNSLVLTWSHGSCIVTFPSWALKELWVSAFLGIPEEGEGPKVTQLPSINLLLKVLHGLNAEKTLNTSRLERLLEEQAKAGAEQQPPPIPFGSGGEDGHAAGEFGADRHRVALLSTAPSPRPCSSSRELPSQAPCSQTLPLPCPWWGVGGER
ncbi:uncharacterized protein [Heliangelus exortis]|uniref:uncharacterized protein n=1 Tax=Heliangelus exortis TaxID=472823 RepID=UPI003A9054AD